MSTDTATEPKCVKSALKRIEEERKQLDKWEVEMRELIDVAQDAEAAIVDSLATVEVSLSRYARQVHISLTGVTDLAVVVPILRKLAALGHRADKGYEYYDNDDKTMRYFRRGSILVFAHLKDGGKCHRVQVGTKEVPVYEIKCDEPVEASA